MQTKFNIVYTLHYIAVFCHIKDVCCQTTMETGVLQLQVRSCGTAFQLI